MAVLDPNEIFFTAFEPKQANRFILYMDGIPSFMIKGTAAITLSQGTVPLSSTPIIIRKEEQVDTRQRWQAPACAEPLRGLV